MKINVILMALKREHLDNQKNESERGAITIIALVTMLFLVSFLISVYVISANRVQAQKEIISEIRNTYAPKERMEEIYNSYFSTEEVIPIYTVEQLLKIGTGEKVNINGKIYTLTSTDMGDTEESKDLLGRTYEYCIA